MPTIISGVWQMDIHSDEENQINKGDSETFNFNLGDSHSTNNSPKKHLQKRVTMSL